LKEIAVISLVVCLACCVTQQYEREVTQQYEREEVGEKVEAEMVMLKSQEYNNGAVEVCILNAGSGSVVIDTEYKNRVVLATGIGQVIEANGTTCFTLQGTDYSAGDECRLITEGDTMIQFTIKE
jgi:hypothetical protein